MKRNLLIITPDQLRADYLSCYGHKNIGTSNIDSLAKEGILFENCYCASPLCAPSRISFATSTYVGEHGHRNYASEISPDVPNLITSLKKSGYRTGMFGKNHLFTYNRLEEVWDELDEICLGNCDKHPLYKHSFTSFTMEDNHPYNITGRLTSETIDFMNNSADPFVAWVNYQDPHPAFACPAPYDTMFNPEDIELPSTYKSYNKNSQPVRNEIWRAHSEMEICSDNDMRKAITTYMGQVRYVDDSVGRLVAALKEKNLLENTIILFFSDHGELLGDYGMTHKLPAFYDCLTKIPVILRVPQTGWQAQRFSGLVEEVELAPTLLDLLDIPIPPTMVGKSLKNALENYDYSGKESILCEAGGGAPTPKQPLSNFSLRAPFPPTSFGPGAMLRMDNWKISVYADDRGEMYHLKNDPLELDNLYGRAEYMEKQLELITALLQRTLAVKTRDIGIEWDFSAYPRDVRFEPLEIADEMFVKKG